MNDLPTDRLAAAALDGLRNGIARLLPEVMEQAVVSYRRFATHEAPQPAKEFKEHYAAGRSALAHLEALLRLARWASLPAETGEGTGERGEEAPLAALVAEARRAVSALTENEAANEPDDD
jgi:hypothetical protein